MDWTWLLLFVGLIFVMQRFGMGCCGGHNHGGHEHHGGDEKKDEPLKSGNEANGKRAEAAPVATEAEDKRA